jgi:hypothetical protein
MPRLASTIGTSLLALLLAAPLGAARAQNQPKTTDQVETEDPQTTAAEDAQIIMTRSLPFLDGQVVRYFSDKGEFEGEARRRGLVIRFYDPSGVYLGRAQRVTQAVTAYYAADGGYLGQRVNQRLVLKRAVTTSNAPDNHGFAEGDPANEAQRLPDR